MKRNLFMTLLSLLLVVLFLPMSVLADPQPPDEHLPPDERPERIEPEGGPVYNVVFHTLPNGVLYGAFAALEGQGVGPKQWPGELARQSYTFMGWFDNLEGTGIAYNMYTPIYKDTDLHAFWLYSGTGGPWPRPRPAGITGIAEGQNFTIDEEIRFTAAGHNMDLVEPKDQRFRWIPVSWQVVESGSFPDSAPFSGSFSISEVGNYTLRITYREEIFDRIFWQDTGKMHEVVELEFSVS